MVLTTTESVRCSEHRLPSPIGRQMSTRTLGVFLDLSVLDHLQRIEAGAYVGGNEDALRRLRVCAENRRVDTWISEITFVEMLHGLENLAGREQQRQAAAGKDAAKQAILASMSVRTLAYPCSRFDDTYSRWDLSFRFAGPDTERATQLETRLLQLHGVSAGDARQLVSCAFPTDGDQGALHPDLDWFVAEDRRLIVAVNAAMSSGQFSELAHLRCGSTNDLVAAHPTLF